MDGKAGAYNSTENPVNIWGRFRHTVVDKPLDDIEEGFQNRQLQPGKSDYWTTSDWGDGTHFDFPTTLNEDEKEWECHTYIRLQTKVGILPEEWFDSRTQTFDYRDHR